MSDDLVKRLRRNKRLPEVANAAADRIEALDAALAKADELAEWVYKKRHSPTNREDFYAVKIATALDSYRAAREATK